MRRTSGSQRLIVGLWPTLVEGDFGGGWFAAMETHVPRCPATHGIPFIVGTGPPEITVGTPSPYGSYPELPPAGSATAVGDVAIAAAHTPARINWRMRAQ